MEIPLNAMDEPHDDESGGASSQQHAPAFTIPVRGNSVSLSSLLSSESDHDAGFAGGVAPIALPQEQQSIAAPPAMPHRPRPRGGLSALMNSPMDDDVVMQDPRGYVHTNNDNSSAGGVTETPATTTMTRMTTTPNPTHDDVNGTRQSATADRTHVRDDTPQDMDVDGAADGNTTASPRSTSDSPVPPRQRNAPVVELNVQSVVLSDSKLESVKSELQSAIQRFLAAEARSESGAPSAKRQKKGKHARSKAKAAVAPAADECLAEVQRCIQRLHRRVSAQFESANVLREVVQLCLSFCAVLHEKDAIDKVIVVVAAAANASGKQTSTSPAGKSQTKATAAAEPTAIDSNSVDFDATLAALAHKPLYCQLLSVVRHAVGSCSEHVATALLAQVLKWCRRTPSAPHRWLWVFAFIGELHGFATLEFLVHELMFADSVNNDDDDDNSSDGATLPVIEYLIAKHPAQVVDIVRELLETAAADGVRELRGKSVASVLEQLVRVATRYPIFLRACDDSLQFFVTRELVVRLAANIYAGNDDSKGGSDARVSSQLLLQLVEQRSSELQSAGFHLVLLLHKLSAGAFATSSEEDLPLASQVELSDAASAFHAQVLAFAEHEEPPSAFVRGVYRFLPYICQSALRALRVGDDQTERPTTTAFDQWRAWLELLARRVSAAEVTQHLIESDLMLHEVVGAERGAGPATLTETTAMSSLAAVAAIRAHDVQLCSLLARILAPQSAQYVQFVQQMMASCSLAGPRVRQRRVLAILQVLLHLTRTHGNDASSHGAQLHMSSDVARELPLTIRMPTGEARIEHVVAQLVRTESWSQSWQRFELWRGTQGVAFWEGFLDLSYSRDREVAARALALVAQTPFQSLEDPAWQYRCLRKLTAAFFQLLRQYRSELVRGRRAVAETQSRLETMKAVLFRVLTLDGAVAHYASSVYTTFVALWVDGLFSTSSPTSIPTHFPNRVNFAAGANGDDDGDDVDGYGYGYGGDTNVGGGLEPRSGEEGRVVIRSERTISSKCTNLQASQVITQLGDTLVYRKALDASWEREMDAAHTCCLYATDVLSQLLSSTVLVAGRASGTGTGAGTGTGTGTGTGAGTGTGTGTTAPSSSRRSAAAATASDSGNEFVERKLKAVVDLLLERALPCCGIPSDDVYKETLPNRSSFDMDLRIEQWLNHFPAFLPLLRVAITTSASIGSSQSLRLVPVLKAALVVLLGHWNSVKGELARVNMDVPPYMRNRNQLALTCELVRILRLTGWLPPPLGRAAELLPLTSPADIRGILFSCWFYLSDHPPSDGPTPASSRTGSPTSAAPSPSAAAAAAAQSAAGGSSSSNHANVPLEFYLVPLRKALHANIRKIGAKYPLFMC